MPTGQLRLALKVLGRRKVFTAISLTGIALTLLVLTVAAAVVDHTFGTHAPETRQDRTLYTFYVQMSGENVTSSGPAGFGLFDRYTRDMPGVERMSLVSLMRTVPVYVRGDRVDVTYRYADADYWRVLDFEFLEGAPFGDADVAEARQVAVVTESTRRRLFGAELAVGRAVDFNGARWTVVGVVPDVSFLRIAAFSEIWVPLTTQPGTAWRTDLDGALMAMYLLAPGADRASVQAEFQQRMTRVDLTGTEYDRVTATADSVLENTARMAFGRPGDATARTPQLVAAVTGVALLFALLPIVNLVNLAVSRIFERAAEIGVRKAFGAPRRALVLQFVLENVVLTLLGGVLALVASALVLRAINASGVIPYGDLALNGRIFAAGLAMSLVFGVLSGAWPAWRMARLHPVEALKGAAR